MSYIFSGGGGASLTPGSPGADTGTLTDAPATGNPTQWFIVTYNGQQYGIPGWQYSSVTPSTELQPLGMLP